MNLEKINKFINYLANQANGFKTIQCESVVLMHHNDTDGLCSGAILVAAFERLGLKVNRICLDFPHKVVFKKVLEIYREPNLAFLLVDLGTAALENSLKDFKKNHIYILDHHTSFKSNYINIINCRDFDIAGDTDCSASSIAYLFAKSLNIENTDLAPLGLLGAYGDGQIKAENNLQSINLLIKNDLKQIIFNPDPLILKFSNFNFSKLKNYLDILGSEGFLKGGADIAIKALLAGFDETAKIIAEKFIESFDSRFKTVFSSLDFKNLNNLDYFVLSDDWKDTSLKSVGLICEEIIKKNLVSQEKYLLGAQLINSSIPGLGVIQELNDKIKVSVRVGEELRERIINKQALSVGEILLKMTNGFNCEPGPSHLFAGSLVIEKDLLLEVVNTIQNFSG